MKRYIILYACTFLVMVPLDFLFLGVLAKSFFRSQVGHAMGDLNLVAAVIFYLVYAAGIIVFANATAQSWQQALLWGALLGFFCYVTFELTSMAILKGWTWPMVAVDVSWGIFVTGVSAAAGYALSTLLARHI